MLHLSDLFYSWKSVPFNPLHTISPVRLTYLPSIGIGILLFAALYAQAGESVRRISSFEGRDNEDLNHGGKWV